MNKKDLPILVVLVALWIAWPYVDRKFFAPPPKEAPPAEQASAEETNAPPAHVEPVTPPEETVLAAPAEPAPPATKAALEPESQVEAQTTILEDDKVSLAFTSRGAALQRVVLHEYRASLDPDSGEMALDFSRRPALAYSNLPGLTPRYDFSIQPSADGREVVFERATAEGLLMRRTIRLDDGYRLHATEEFVNKSEQAVVLSASELELGGMYRQEGAAKSKSYGRMYYLGVDALLQSGQGVKHWGRNLNGWMKDANTDDLNREMHTPVNWVAAKTKFFVQILTPEDGLDDVVVRASREPGETSVKAISAAGVWPSLSLPAGGTILREYTYYVGPKKHAVLKQYGLHQTQVMELGWAGGIGAILLATLNLIHDYLWPHNYGLAIMLLTIIIRVAFWPLTHKGTENMKRMQELQPLMKEIREKFKDNAQKQQQEMMALYKKHKVNPMMGCLPMLVQIPVFISLFYVLRSAIELRFADFLWVKDLSEPENLIAFGFALPLIGWDSLNILPLLMAATTLIQQKLTPTAGDPSQQKMMMIMPFVMLIFLYNFASGLVLYWTTNNLLMIVQQYMQRRRAREKVAAAEA